MRRAALALLLLTSPAHAETAPTPDAQKPVAAFGADHPDCIEWTDGCIVCRRNEMEADCSMAGIACLPAEPACLDHKK